ncbi:MAG: restriction endonuclease [Paludibacteraceae bacterium]|nr:restriction endonuclease [Paludibacteraceae bacterium]
MAKKNQSNRLVAQQKAGHGALSIFGPEAKKHDVMVGYVAMNVLKELEKLYPSLSFRYRTSISKEEINNALKKIDAELGQTLFVKDANIKPDGGLIEVKDDKENWRVVLVSEAKHQGKDIENVTRGIKVGVNNNQDFMVAGNAIERAHKNISEIANYMLNEGHFPYVLFLEGSNFITENVVVKRPNGETLTIRYDVGSLNRLDRLTAANYGMPINTNLCRNKFIESSGRMIMLQAASMFTQGAGGSWSENEMSEIMLDVAKTSIKILASDLFNQLTTR